MREDESYNFYFLEGERESSPLGRVDSKANNITWVFELQSISFQRFVLRVMLPRDETVSFQ